ncbi:MAG: 16S rRNA (uracil(1498)-N(3))-methyltransferase [Acidobacteriota bacterium]
MARRRFYAPPVAFNANSTNITLPTEEARHLREVLRLKPGDEVYVFDGAGKEFQCVIEDSRRDSALLKVLAEVAPARPESRLALTLAVAFLKSDKFDLVVQKATELGVVRIVPVMTHLADIRLRDESDANKRVARWQRIAMEAAKQSGRALVPEVAAPVTFAALAQNVVPSGPWSVMFSERGGQAFPATKAEGTPQEITALVGSEGGWTDEELEQARTADWQIVTLGGRILRAETAAIAVTALLQHRYGDLK